MQHRFGDTLRRLRKERELTYRAMSDLLESSTGVAIDASGIQRMEAGSREPRLNEALAIAQTLGVGLDEMSLGNAAQIRTMAIEMMHAVDELGEFMDYLDSVRERARALKYGTQDPDERAKLDELLLLSEFMAAVAKLDTAVEESEILELKSRLRHPSRSTEIFQ